MTLVLHYAARSDRGLVRSNNQDSVYAGPRLLALADGMGGHAAGEVASKVVIAALAPLDDDEPGDDLLGQLRQAVHSGNSAISELVSSDPDLDGMGTTLTAVLFAGSKLGMVHIGDSRAYLVRDGELTQITHDDTFVQSLIDEGRITEEEAATHPQRSLLLKALTGHEVEPSLNVREARAGDRYLLCSDGLTSPVSEETVAEALRIADPQQCADRLIELALKGGGPDNVTVIVADVVDVEFGEDAPIVGGAAGNGEEDPQPDSSAARASAATMPKPEPERFEPSAPPADPNARKRRWWRPVLVLCGVLAVLGATAVVGRWWWSNQYFISVNQANDVAIFQGLQGSVLGVSMNRQIEDSCPPGSPKSCEPINLKDLQEAKRPDVQRGITAVDSREDARKAMWRLRTTAVLPPCPAPGQDEPHRPDPNQGDEHKPDSNQGDPNQVDPNRPDPNQPDPSRPSLPPDQNSTPPETPPNREEPPPESSAADSTPLEQEEQKPGVTCRTVS